MAHNISHFSIHADDLERARRFYENVFGWKFTPWGPPGFLLIATGDEKDPGIQGALQKRREPLNGGAMTGYECTVTVDDVDGIAAKIEANGGRITFPKATIPTVGVLIQFSDTEGNIACAMRYDKNAA